MIAVQQASTGPPTLIDGRAAQEEPTDGERTRFNGAADSHRRKGHSVWSASLPRAVTLQKGPPTLIDGRNDAGAPVPRPKGASRGRRLSSTERRGLGDDDAGKLAALQRGRRLSSTEGLPGVAACRVRRSLQRGRRLSSTEGGRASERAYETRRRRGVQRGRRLHRRKGSVRRGPRSVDALQRGRRLSSTEGCATETMPRRTASTGPPTLIDGGGATAASAASPCDRLQRGRRLSSTEGLRTEREYAGGKRTLQRGRRLSSTEGAQTTRGARRDELQRGRRLSSTEGPAAAAPRLRRVEGFNGAADSHRRKAPRALAYGIDSIGFNGAADSHRRKGS